MQRRQIAPSRPVSAIADQRCPAPRILLAAIIIWLGHKRGMNYWNWLIVYLGIACVDLLIRVTIRNATLEIIVDSIAVLYLAAFFNWPHIVPDTHKQALDQQAKENAENEIRRSEQYYKTLEDWLVVKTYVDASQTRELHADKEKLDGLAIASHVKSAGITTLSVHKDQFESACTALDIQPLVDPAPGPEAE